MYLFICQEKYFFSFSRELADFLGKDCKTAKLFSKHMKVSVKVSSTRAIRYLCCAYLSRWWSTFLSELFIFIVSCFAFQYSSNLGRGCMSQIIGVLKNYNLLLGIFGEKSILHRIPTPFRKFECFMWKHGLKFAERAYL